MSVLRAPLGPAVLQRAKGYHRFGPIPLGRSKLVRTSPCRAFWRMLNGSVLEPLLLPPFACEAATQVRRAGSSILQCICWAADCSGGCCRPTFRRSRPCGVGSTSRERAGCGYRSITRYCLSGAKRWAVRRVRRKDAATGTLSAR